MNFDIKMLSSYDEILSEQQRNAFVPGNEKMITRTEYDRISDMIRNIIRYYKDNFEFGKYKNDDNTYECVVKIDFMGGFKSTSAVKDEEFNVDSFLNNDEAEVARRYRTKTLKLDAESFEMDKIATRDKNYEYVMTSVMRDVFLLFLENEGLSEDSFKTYLNGVKDRIDKVAGKLDEEEKSDDDNTVIDMMENFKEEGDDEWGTYGSDLITIYWPRISLFAMIGSEKLRSAGKNINEDEVKWNYFETTLAHEMFHFFHDCCVNDPSEDDTYKEHMRECLAEYFCLNYIGDKQYAVTYNKEFGGSSDRNPTYFAPGDEDSDRGYSGAAILLNVRGLNKRTLTEGEQKMYECFFDSIASKEDAQNACACLVELRDTEELPDCENCK